jgi:hypothetical protein
MSNPECTISLKRLQCIVENNNDVEGMEQLTLPRSLVHLIHTFWLSTTFRFRAEITNVGRSNYFMSLRNEIGNTGDVLMPVLAAVYGCVCVCVCVCVFSHTYVCVSCVTASLHSKVL